jgi:hypothetical protein
MIAIAAWITAPFAAAGLLAAFVFWSRSHHFGGCCPPPEKGRVWVCGHRKAWCRLSNAQWWRISKRRYVRLAMTELDNEIEKAIRGGSKS